MNQELSIGITLPTKEVISEVSMNIIDKIRNGEMNPLESVVKLAAVEKVCEMIRDGISEQVLRELDKENGKTVLLGAKIDRKEVGVKWSYENDAWKSFKAVEDKAVEKRKAVEKIAQNVPDGTELNYTDTDTGETFLITRGTKTSKTGFAVILGKE
jgi:Fe-S cluster assembly iron-binding protein IscA